MISDDDINHQSCRTLEEGNQKNDNQNSVLCNKSDSVSIGVKSESSDLSSPSLSYTCPNNNGLIESSKAADNKQYDSEEGMRESSNCSDDSCIYFGNSIPEGHKSSSGFEDVILVATTDQPTHLSSTPILSNDNHEQVHTESDKGNDTAGTVLGNEPFVDTVSSNWFVEPDSVDSSVLEMDLFTPAPSNLKPNISSPFLYSPFPNVSYYSQLPDPDSKLFRKRPRRARGKNFPSCVKKRILDLYDDLRFRNPSAQIRFIAAIIEMRIKEEFKDLDLNSSILTFLYNSRRTRNPF